MDEFNEFYFKPSVKNRNGGASLDELEKFKQTLESELIDEEEMALFIFGHADERHTSKYNFELATKRACIVSAEILSHTFKKHNIKIISYGEERASHPDNSLSKEQKEKSYSLDRKVVISNFVVKETTQPIDCSLYL